MSPDSLVYVASALLGALVGGLVSLGVSARSARRARRERYGEALLAALSAAHRKVDNHPSDETLRVREEALSIWVQAELAATLELPPGRRAMQSWAVGLYEGLANASHGDIDQLEQQLDIAVYLVVAWTAGHARGRDFTRPVDELVRHFAPYTLGRD